MRFYISIEVNQLLYLSPVPKAMYSSIAKDLIEKIPTSVLSSLSPSSSSQKTLKIDLILEGGIFNGSYMMGVLFYLKELEKRKIIQIKRVSGTSIGSLLAFIYLIDGLDALLPIYSMIYQHFKQKCNLELYKQMGTFLESVIPEDVCQRVHKKLFIKYHHVPKRKSVIKSSYTSKEDIMETIVRSSYVPFLIDGKVLHEQQYLDGLLPFVFKERKDRRIMYIDLLGINKITHLICVKNEESNSHRILSGMLDVHYFFLKQQTTSMCSFCHQWGVLHRSRHTLKFMIEWICLQSMYVYSLLVYMIPREIYETKVFKKRLDRWFLYYYKHLVRTFIQRYG